MTKAFDFKVLAEKLKSRGLDVAEEAAKIIVEETLTWTEESVKLSENKYDDIIVLGIPMIKEAALKAVDQIDGKPG